MNQIKKILSKRKVGINSGVPSFCCANKIVVESILEQAKQFDDFVVIEATSNQVNQNGGYTKMQPIDFVKMVEKIAKKTDFPMSRIILGGDHLGPLPWCDQPADVAMANAEVLVRLFVSAGYTKIHLDTSMRLGDDDVNKPLSTEIIAARGARLYKACEKAFAERLKKYPDSVHPVYVIGSEVPVPGGATKEEKMVVTSPSEFEETIYAYKKVFLEYGLGDAWENIVAVVIQPGVEFSNTSVRRYDREDAKKLCRALKRYPDLVFEGHSTDYQSPNSLREMVQDGIAILKVGPALTFALREALFQLSGMEKELVKEDKQAHFIELLEEEMVKNPKYWEKYYLGSEEEKKLNRKYGFSDRSRYYMTLPNIEEAIEKLLVNLENVEIPMGMLKQYMPIQYARCLKGMLEPKPRALLKDSVVQIVEDYNFAVMKDYFVERD
ncbi:MAG: class II D-tagatose-bisphosphate aldolase, non-catalytic subunit [Bacilli bacterium]|nr:class II D-tagatose-bisphosphate aldolase, non-catalytic subunit [Bacilli bacterium]